MTGQSPAMPQRRLRAELRSGRVSAELTQQQVADAIDWSLSKVIRIENGSVAISVNDLRALLQLYGMADRADELVDVAREARERSWWSQYRGIASSALIQYIEFESAASTVRSFQPLLVPGLLQTPDYARAVFGGFAPEHMVEDLIKVRLKRQELLRRAKPPTLYNVVDEGVVRHLVGGPAVMRNQLQHLADLASRPNITLAIVPFAAGVHPAMRSPFVILEFPDAQDDDVLYLENPNGDVTDRDDTDEVARFAEAFEELNMLALSPQESIGYLRTLAGV